MVSTAHSVKIRPCFKGNLCAGARNGFARSNDALDIYTHIYFSSQVNIYISTVLENLSSSALKTDWGSKKQCPQSEKTSQVLIAYQMLWLLIQHWLWNAHGRYRVADIKNKNKSMLTLCLTSSPRARRRSQAAPRCPGRWRAWCAGTPRRATWCRPCRSCWGSRCRPRPSRPDAAPWANSFLVIVVFFVLCADTTNHAGTQ